MLLQRKKAKKRKSDHLLPKLRDSPVVQHLELLIGGSFLPLPKPRQHQLFVYQPPVLDLNGPLPPSAEDIKKKGFLKHIRSATTAERAGGYSEITSCMRALQEAMSGLFYVPRARLEVD